MEKELRIIISGGGTGGHIFPAVSIANAITELRPEAKILFVGAEGRMEMQRVPDAGYEIIGLPIAGFDRKRLWKNVAVLVKLARSQWKARSIIKNFLPQVAVGVGGYASGPTLKTAGMMGVPTLIQEQNSYAGVTNKLLASKASKICVAYEGMEKFFPADKIILTGNPVRQDLFDVATKAKEAYEYFGFSPTRKTILIVGGSLGARTINLSIKNGLDKLTEKDVQIIWQTGKLYAADARAAASTYQTEKLVVTDFVSRMDYAYSIADLVISRAGASSISELCLLAKPVILVPSPNVAEDHQTKNALALVNKDAAIMIRDMDASNDLVSKTLELISDNPTLERLSKNILQLALPNSADRIAEEVFKIIKKK